MTKMLYVDDNKINCELYAGLFETYGYEVLTAEDGIKAQEVLRKTSGIDVMITDEDMPNMTGSQLAKSVRTDSTSPYQNMLIIGITGRDHSNNPDWINHTNKQYMKPVSAKTLHLFIAAELAKRQQPSN